MTPEQYDYHFDRIKTICCDAFFEEVLPDEEEILEIVRNATDGVIIINPKCICKVCGNDDSVAVHYKVSLINQMN